MAALSKIRQACLGVGQGARNRAELAQAGARDRGAHFRSAYEIYAHVLVAEARGLPEEKISTIVAGQRPSDLTREEAVAYDVASTLVAGRLLLELTYRQAVGLFSENGTAELINLIGLYCAVSITLNGFDVPVPDEVRG
jgi:4-carboxymuconolactone decarboxylase